MSQESTRLREFLEENPKWIGVMFSALLLLSQAGSAAAANGGTMTGP
ncbi:DUF7503 family protein [Halosimplex carlsbadense]|nr:hypothetical protein [Halosimplex carlsbadense]